jgi:hypothetical protein
MRTMKGTIWVCLGVGAALCLASLSWARLAEEPSRRGFKLSEHTPHLWIYWNCDRSRPRSLAIEGMIEVKGQSNSPVYGLRLTLVGLDQEGRAITETAVIAPPKLLQGGSFRFRLTLPYRGKESDFGLRVFYRYLAAEGGGMKVSRIAYTMDFYDWTFREICPPE